MGRGRGRRVGHHGEVELSRFIVMDTELSHAPKHGCSRDGRSGRRCGLVVGGTQVRRKRRRKKRGRRGTNTKMRNNETVRKEETKPTPEKRKHC
eukprot:scaffold905_cov363-Pavlova_lutheri.AAC.1